MTAQAWLPRIDPLACTGAGDCVPACPTQALGLVGGQAVVARPDACTYCAECEAVCPVGAIALPYQIVFSQAPSPGSPGG
jgi:thioredoxin reductase (NADPH)